MENNDTMDSNVRFLRTAEQLEGARFLLRKEANKLERVKMAVEILLKCRTHLPSVCVSILEGINETIGDPNSVYDEYQSNIKSRL